MMSEPLDLNALSPPELTPLTTGADMWSTAAVPQAGIPSFKMADGPMGIASGRVDERDVSVLTPCGLALGASWDTELVGRVGALVGREALSKGVGAVLAPNLNLPRSPLAGRAFELFSEDPLLAGALGVAWLGGLQQQGVGAVAKHLVCNDSETERNSMNAVVDERALREVYLLPFEMAVAAGCTGLLVAYNRLNGEYCVEHEELLSGIVKREWGYQGFLVSDWFGTRDTVRSATAGLDLEMPGPDRCFGKKLLVALNEGKVTDERIRDAAGRVARAAQRVRGPKTPTTLSSDRREVLVEAAAAGFVLLKNEGNLLPLAPARKYRIAVIGPNAAAPCYQGGTFAKIALDPNTARPIDAIRARFGADCEVTYEMGVEPRSRLPPLEVMPAIDLGDGATRGMSLEYFDSHDFASTPIARETRDTNSLTWFAGLPGIAARVDSAAGVRAQGKFRAQLSGRHQFFVGATGSLRMRLDGREVYRRDLSLAGADIMGRLKAGDADFVEAILDAGQVVHLEVELRYEAARVHGLWYGIKGPDQTAQLLKRAVKAATDADAVVLMVGETADSSVESKDRDDTLLAQEQVLLLQQIHAVNKRTVVVANVGHSLNTSWLDHAAALLMVWYPGEEFARALADVLAGDREPGGRMPVTVAGRDSDYPVFSLMPERNGDVTYSESWRIGYRSFRAGGISPQHCLGAGFGYAHFQLRDISMNAADLSVGLTVCNLTARAGKAVVQLYAQAVGEDAPVLAGFAALLVPANSNASVRVDISRMVLRRWDRASHAWDTGSREVQFWIGQSLDDPQMTRLKPMSVHL
jgi:beta-glucosidase